MANGNLEISVLIPTFKRAEYLARSLESLTKQQLARAKFEVIVINDASGDNTAEVCAQFQNKLKLKYIELQDGGLAAAKNAGIFAAQGRIILFFDDDDIADQHLLEQHLNLHQRQAAENVAILGYTEWSPSLKITPLMHYVTGEGSFLFCYPQLRHLQELDYTFFWGGRSSCKRSLLYRHGIFNQQYKFGLEDIELSWRLFKKAGLKVIYNQHARQFMIRPISYEQFCQRCYRQGESQYHFSRLYADEEVQRYCQADGAEERWLFNAALLPDKEAKAHETDELLAKTSPTSSAAVMLLTQLQTLYRWIFFAYKFKGYYEAKQTALAEQQKHLVSDRQQFVKKWPRRVEPPKLARPLNILFAYRHPPLFDRASGELRFYNLIRILRQQGHQVTMANDFGRSCDDTDLAPYAAAMRSLGVQIHALDTPAMQLTIEAHRDPDTAFRWLVRDKKFDLAIMPFHQFAIRRIPSLRELSPQTKIVIDSVDVHFLREARRALASNDPILIGDYLRKKNNELSAYAAADVVLTVTDADRHFLGHYLQERPIFTVPDPHTAHASTTGFAQRRDLIFIGGFRHLPNVDAVKFFHQQIWPLVQDRLPQVRLLIVGADPPPDIKTLATEKNIFITGYVPDLEPLLEQKRLAIAPLRYGAGMKGKIAVCLANGLPNVITSIGAEGLGVKHEEQVLIADRPDEFAEAIVRLYTDENLWRRMAEAGRQCINLQFADEKIISCLEPLLTLAQPNKEITRSAPIKQMTPDTWSSDPLLKRAEALSLGYQAMLADHKPLRAREYFQKMPKIDGQPDPLAHLGYAICEALNKNFSAAENILRTYLEHPEAGKMAYALLGKTLELAQRGDEAKTYYQQAVQLDRDNTWLMTEAGYFFERNHCYELAGYCYHRLAELLFNEINPLKRHFEMLTKIGSKDWPKQKAIIEEIVARAKRLQRKDMLQTARDYLAQLEARYNAEQSSPAPATAHRPAT